MDDKMGKYKKRVQFVDEKGLLCYNNKGKKNTHKSGANRRVRLVAGCDETFGGQNKIKIGGIFYHGCNYDEAITRSWRSLRTSYSPLEP
jgi:hypothetical protein